MGRKLIAVAAAIAAAVVALQAQAAHAAGPARCGLIRIAELPVTMDGLTPTVPVKINGSDMRLVADSGAFYSLISPGAAAERRLSLHATNLTIRGLGGDAAVYVTTVKTFTLAGVDLANIQFLVGGSEAATGGLLGQNVLGLADAEYDFAGGAIRLMKPHDCPSNQVLAYWASGKPISQLEIRAPDPVDPQTTGYVEVNGVKLRAVFDTGASHSMLTLAGAAKAGLKPGAASVSDAGYVRGLGRRLVRSWIGTVQTLKIGDEEVRTTRLRMGDFDLNGADLLLGADFFLSHRVYVSNRQHRMYFTYNGGPVFNLESGAMVQQGGEAPKASLPTSDGRAEPTDAEGFARRAAAEASRRDLAHALADFDQAVKLAPAEPRYLCERGMAHWEDRKADAALADFDQALKLKPDDADCLIARSQMRAGLDRRQGALDDLDAAVRALPAPADDRLTVARLYLRLDAFQPAIGQFDAWIAAHREDSRRPEALDGRCRARALLGTDLDKALSDCSAAIGSGPKSSEFLTDRGIVRLRRGEADKALTDFQAAIAIDAADARALYGRGLARVKLGKAAEGQADIAAATQREPVLAPRWRRLGIAP